jgi:hypothetical protein
LHPVQCASAGVCPFFFDSMYYGIVIQNTKASAGSSQGYLVGYGLVIPLALWLPFQAIDWLDIRNVGFRLGCGSLPMTVTLRCLEAMHGVVAPAAKQSLRDYVVSVGFILRPMFDRRGQTIPLTRKIFVQTMLKHFVWLGIFTLLFHVAWPSGFYPFATAVEANDVLVSFEVGHLYNTFVQAGKLSSNSWWIDSTNCNRTCLTYPRVCLLF